MAQTLAQKRAWGKKDYHANHKKRRAYLRAWYHAHSAQAAARSRLRKYGLTTEAWNTIFADQGGGCAICKRPDPGHKHGWHTDHDHSTGKVRGILCFGCNLGLGGFRDNQTVLRLATEYLDHNQDY